jgi:hypothetical protein
MSAENTQVLSPEEQVLASKVYMPVFLSKVAQYGIVPKTEDEVVELVKIAQMLDVVETSAPAEVKSQQATVIKAASVALEGHLRNAGAALVDAFTKDPEISKAAEAIAKA